jgi:hypothetical protein
VNKLLTVLLCLISCSFVLAQDGTKSFPGFFPFEWNEDKGTIYLVVDKIDQEFIYINSLAAGLGSNDLGLDRGQLGNTRIVKFIRAGNKILLVQPNQKYRAISDNHAEVKAVKEAFANSVIWGFPIKEKRGNGFLIDMTSFLLRDAHGVIKRLKAKKQGEYKLEESRSAIWMDRTKNFPKNSEFEVLLTFVGEAKGAFIMSVAPDADAVSVRQHHSFVSLPEKGYKPRVYHPGSGFFNISFYDYAAPIHEDMDKKYIVRHRLEKKNPANKMSEAVKPIIYYLDPGCPEPVKSALLDGAGWWNKAFEEAGYKDAFQLKILPEGADPLDVRYNVIQWVHRSTRGWSYGASVVDPRTGEIMKGHVSLGSLRVRQDFMIAQGILSPYGKKENHELMEEMALARLRQLSAHEIGHTIGLAHNFAASYNDRASVMDYPHPFIKQKKGKFDFSKAYDDKIGAWDKRTVLYGYQDFKDDKDEEKELLKIIRENEKKGFLFISDPDARPISGAHPNAHLWDNGENAVEELSRLMSLRTSAMKKFGENSIPKGSVFSKLENVFVPVYMMHRYQIEAAAKLIGGYNYNYAVKESWAKRINEPVKGELQQEALNILLNTLQAKELSIPDHIKELLFPPAYGYDRNRESFNGKTGVYFDPISAAESLAQGTLSLLLNPERMNRMQNDPNSSPGGLGLAAYLSKISDQLANAPSNSENEENLNKSVFKIFFYEMIRVLENEMAYEQVKSSVFGQIEQILNPSGEDLDAFTQYLSLEWTRWLNGDLNIKQKTTLSMPPGSPIGCGNHF